MDNKSVSKYEFSINDEFYSGLIIPNGALKAEDSPTAADAP
jgi:hypothetical protein